MPGNPYKKFDFTYKSVIDKQLNEVKNDENREKCVQVHIKTETPLNILIREKMLNKHWLRFIIRCNLNLISMSWLEQERVAHPPEQSGDHQANPDLSISQLIKILLCCTQLILQYLTMSTNITYNRNFTNPQKWIPENWSKIVEQRQVSPQVK